MRNKPLPLLTLGLLGLAVTGCTPIVATRGNLVENNRLEQVKPGQTTREQVQYVLGVPSAPGVLDPNTWYYVGRRTEQTAFFQAEVAEQRIVRVRFDDRGIVSAIDELKGPDDPYIEPDGDATATTGRELTFMEQLLGNLGGPTKKKDDKKKKGKKGGDGG